MPKVRVHNLSVSLDGYASGPDQSPDNPLGVGGEDLHEWAVATQHWREFHGMGGGDEGLDNDFLAAGDRNIGATIMGRNMFAPIRGPWEDDEWKGWWGDDPPFHHPVFVLTNHPRESVAMQGGTTFHFVTEGIEVAYQRAVAAAGGRDVRIGGGSNTIQQYIRAGLVDEMHVAIVPVLLGGGQRLLDNLGNALDAYECVEFVKSPAVAHFRLAKRQR